MELHIYRCDVCGQQKGASNHWWRARIGNALHIYHWDYFGEGGNDESIPTKHICGQGCLQRLLDGFVSAPFGVGSTIIGGENEKDKSADSNSNSNSNSGSLNAGCDSLL